MSDEDDAVKTFLNSVDENFWNYMVRSIKQARFLPGGDLNIKLSSPPPLDTLNTASNDSLDSRDRDNNHRIKDLCVLDRIVNFASGQLIPGASLHRFTSLNGQAVRDVGTMPTSEGRNSSVAIVTVRFEGSLEETQLALKWNRTGHDQLIPYERRVLDALKFVPGVVKLLPQGHGMLPADKLGKPVLVMDYAYSHRQEFEILNVAGLNHLGIVMGHILDAFHSRGLVHRNVSCQTIRVDPRGKHFTIASLQYTSLSESASEGSKQQAAALGIGKPPMKPQSRNLPWYDEQRVDEKNDALMLGSVLLSCMMRDSGFFLNRGFIDLSKLGSGSDLSTLRLLEQGVSTFNTYISEGDPRLEMSAVVVAVIQGLLRKNPEERLSCRDALLMLQAHPVPPLVRFKNLVVPARFNAELNEMQRPYEIFTTVCIGPDGDPVQGFGLRAVGAARQGDLICAYEGQCISKFHADMMTA